eukprot:gene25460-30740_t
MLNLDYPGNAPLDPSLRDNQMVQMAFRDFDTKNLVNSEKEFSMAIERWKELSRPRDEVVSLIKARANVRLDSKQFDAAMLDYNVALQMMQSDGEDSSGLARYPEYPDTFVGRGLAKEGLADWAGALQDYDKAVSLWGGRVVEKRDSSQPYSRQEYDGINPYVLTYRGNVLSKLHNYPQALRDYEAAAAAFEDLRDTDRCCDVQANLALTLYAMGRQDEGVQAMRGVIARRPASADMHVALAAHDWAHKDYVEALKEWRLACGPSPDSTCALYSDAAWVKEVRRWPDSLADELDRFLRRQID